MGRVLRSTGVGFGAGFGVGRQGPAGVLEAAEEETEEPEPPPLCVCGHRKDRHGIDVDGKPYCYSASEDGPPGAYDCDCQRYDDGMEELDPIEGGERCERRDPERREILRLAARLRELQDRLRPRDPRVELPEDGQEIVFRRGTSGDRMPVEGRKYLANCDTDWFRIVCVAWWPAPTLPEVAE